MLNIVMPLAGRGQRFRDAGYPMPKPLVPVHGRPMVELVVENIRPTQPHRCIFLALREHLERWALVETLNRIAPDCVIIPVSQVTEGAACTVLLARDHIDASEPLMIANSDQWTNTDIEQYLEAMKDLDGLIMTMQDRDPKWSFAEVNAAGLVTRTAEKEPISDQATVGIYNFRNGQDFIRGAELMIAKNLRVNGEFYVCPVYNQLIGWGARIGIYNVGPFGVGMHGLGTPEDLERFLRHPASQSLKVCGKAQET